MDLKRGGAGGLSRQIQKFRLEIERKVRDLAGDTKLQELFDQEQEELKRAYNEKHGGRVNAGGEEDADYLRRNKLLASEWLMVQREQLKSRKDTS